MKVYKIDIRNDYIPTNQWNCHKRFYYTLSDMQFPVNLLPMKRSVLPMKRSVLPMKRSCDIQTYCSLRLTSTVISELTCDRSIMSEFVPTVAAIVQAGKDKTERASALAIMLYLISHLVDLTEYTYLLDDCDIKRVWLVSMITSSPDLARYAIGMDESCMECADIELCLPSLIWAPEGSDEWSIYNEIYKPRLNVQGIGRIIYQLLCLHGHYIGTEDNTMRYISMMWYDDVITKPIKAVKGLINFPWVAPELDRPDDELKRLIVPVVCRLMMTKTESWRIE